MRGVCRLVVASLRRMSKWSGDGRRMLEVGCRCEAYVGSGVAMRGVCWRELGDARRMLEVEGRWEAYVEVEGRWEAYVEVGCRWEAYVD